MPAIKWGKDNEPVARTQYAEGVISSGHTNLKVSETGLSISTEMPYLAASPDGFVSCDCHGIGVLEIKCPYKHRESSVADMVQDSSSPFSSDFGFKKDHPYYAQVQLQMFVTGSTFCDFLVWLPSGWERGKSIP